VQHFILTKLAVGQPPVKWLANRLAIFKTFCAPSVRSQTNQNFRWVLAVNSRTPEWFLRHTRAAAPEAIVVYCDGPGIYPNWSNLLAPYIGSRRLITTRLDSDDLLHKGFVSRVQAEAALCEGDFVVDFPVGYRLQIPGFTCGIIRSVRPTHFLSLVESGRQTAYRLPHEEMGRQFVVRLVRKPPFWVEIRHRCNILERFCPPVERVAWHRIRSSFLDDRRAGG